MSDINVKLAQLLRDKLSEPVYFRASQSPDGQIMLEQVRFLRTEELAAFIGVGERTIRGWVAKGQVPYHKPPGSSANLFDVNEIIKWLDEGMDPSGRRQVA